MKIKHLLEEHEAIEASYTHWGANDPEKAPIDIIMSGSSITFRLTKLPNEIKFNLPEDVDLQDALRKKYETIFPMLADLKEKNPEAYERINEKKFSKEDEHFEQRLKAEIAEEFGQLFDHMVTMLKSRIVTFAHEYLEEANKHHANHTQELAKEIKAELAK